MEYNNYIQRIAVAVLCAWLQQAAMAQKQVASVQQTWVAYFNQTRLTGHWGVGAELQLHTKEKLVSHCSQALLSLSGSYFMAGNTRLTAGYTYVDNYPSESHKKVSQPEHRIWQQLQWQNTYTTFRLMQYIRLEQRFKQKIKNDYELADDYTYTNRVRYNIAISKPINKKSFAAKTVALVVNDELYINFGKQIVYNYYDQNRIFVGFNYYLNNHDYVQAGYMNAFEQLSSGNKYRDTHVARFYFYHNLDLRSKRSG